jgi:hypothetical protein
MSFWWLSMPRTVCPGGCGGWSWECMCHLYEQDRISDELAEKAYWAEYERQYEVFCQNDYELNGCGFDRIAMGM